jgi:hypothetical protein
MDAVRIIEGRYGRLTPELYQRLALRTYQGGHLTPEATLLYHACKIIEEVHEVHNALREDRIEELGDVVWHVSGLLHALGIELSDAHLPKSSSWGPAMDHAVAIGSMIAKHVGQGKELDRERVMLMIVVLMSRLAGLSPHGWPMVMAENILKLEKRYNIA